MVLKSVYLTMAAGIFASALSSGVANADEISPLTYTNDTLAIDESVTIRKTVVVSRGSPTDALLDVMFLFDTTGSMGGPIASAKSASTALLTGLASFGNLASGTGYYGDPTFEGVVSNLSTADATTIASINAFAAGFPDNGGDEPELTNAGVNDAATSTTWRPGSNRFIIALGDASSKDTPIDAVVQAALAANNVKLIGLNYGGTGFADSITSLGGTVFAGGTSADSLIAAITAGITSGFASYSTVGVSDLGGGLPGIGVSSVCVSSAGGGVCNGSLAEGEFDRETENTFEFDVTFTRIADGTFNFGTFALVDGGIVATERDTFSGSDTPVIPLPAAGWLLLAGIGALAAAKRRKNV